MLQQPHAMQAYAALQVGPLEISCMRGIRVWLWHLGLLMRACCQAQIYIQPAETSPESGRGVQVDWNWINL